MEEGTPTSFSEDWSGTLVTSETASAAPGDGAALATTSSQGAWQRVVWRDIVGIILTSDVTQINWSYNGSSVSGGTTTGAWALSTASKWQLLAKTVSQLYGSGNVYYRGQTTAHFYNDYFCDPFPPVDLYYYYNRVWGHYNGTATRAQSSDPVGECAPLHMDIYAGYGQWS